MAGAVSQGSGRHIHLSSHFSFTTDPSPLISHHHTNLLHFTPSILHTAHLAPLILHYASDITHITLRSTASYTAHLKPFILHHSSYITYLTLLKDTKLNMWGYPILLFGFSFCVGGAYFAWRLLSLACVGALAMLQPHLKICAKEPTLWCSGIADGLQA